MLRLEMYPPFITAREHKQPGNYLCHPLRFLPYRHQAFAAVGRIAAQGVFSAGRYNRQRRPELMGCVRRELALSPEGILEPVKHLVKGLGELSYLVLGFHTGYPSAEFPAAYHLRGLGYLPYGLHGALGQKERAQRRERQIYRRKHKQKQHEVAQGIVHIFCRACGHYRHLYVPYFVPLRLDSPLPPLVRYIVLAVPQAGPGKPGGIAAVIQEPAVFIYYAHLHAAS